MLTTAPHTRAWRNTWRALTKSLAPMKWATWTEKPVDTAPITLPMSQVVDSMSPMLAEAAAPRCPTMAASMKNMSTVVICARMDGTLRSTINLSFSCMVIVLPMRIFSSNISLRFAIPYYIYGCKGTHNYRHSQSKWQEKSGADGFFLPRQRDIDTKRFAAFPGCALCVCGCRQCRREHALGHSPPPPSAPACRQAEKPQIQKVRLWR